MQKRKKILGIRVLFVLSLLIPKFLSAEPAPVQVNWGTDEGVFVDISNISIDNFPGIHLFVRVTDNQGYFIQDLGVSNFEVREDGALTSINIDATMGNMAATLVMDESGSMSGYGQDVIEACSYFVNGLDDYDKGAIVKFATYSSVDVPMTYNKDDLLESISEYQTSGLTDLWDAIWLGIQECYYENEKKAVVAFTDGNDNQPGYFAAQLPELAGSDITIYAIGIGNIDPDSLIWVAEATGGFYLPIEDPTQMQQVLEDIRNDISNLYDIYYVTPNPAPNGRSRAIQVVCDYEGEVGWDTASYVAPTTTPPVLTLTNETRALLGEAQNPGATLYAGISVEAENPIEEARIYHRITGEQYYEQDDLVVGAGNTYYYNLSGAEVQAPGVEFYFQVTDNEGNTVTLPGYSPAYLPYSIAVLPNYAPVISFYPPGIWLTRKSFTVQMTATDSTNAVMAVSMFYRIPGSFFYSEYPLQNLGGNEYYGVIEGPLINYDDDFEFFIVAWDNHGVSSYWFYGDDPFYLDVVQELPPTPPAVAMEPEEQPILIPANGGDFNYTIFVINPIPGEAECDVWAEIEYPSGAIGDPVMTIYDLALEGGETYIENLIQEVPDTAAAGEYTFIMHTGEIPNDSIYYTASFNFTKLSSYDGGSAFSNGWRWYYKAELPLAITQYDVRASIEYSSELSSNPNPFNAATRISFYLPLGGEIKLTMHNITGETIATLAEGLYGEGLHSVNWNASDNSSGVYFCRMIVSGEVHTKKLLLIK